MTAVTRAVNKAIKAGAKTVVNIDASTARFIAAVREYAKNPVKGWGWELVPELSDDDLAKIVNGALTVKTAIKKTARYLYREADPYGRIAAIKARV